MVPNERRMVDKNDFFFFLSGFCIAVFDGLP